MERLAAPNNYLYTLRSHWGYPASTVNTYAWALYDFFSWVDANRKDWTFPSNPRDPLATPLLAEYRNFQKALSQKTGRPGLGTIRQYLTVCRGFYKWANENGLLRSSPIRVDATESDQESPRSPYIDSARANTLRTKRSVSAKCLSLSQIATLCGSIDNPRDRFMVVLALGSGLRRSEIVSFPAQLIPDHVLTTNPLERIPIDIRPWPNGPANERIMCTKGSVPRRIYIDPKVVEALAHYKIYGPRISAARNYEATYHAKPPRLFLSAAGKPLEPSHLNRLCSRLSKQVGFDVWPHLLRHTYATHELHVESQRRSETEALIWVSERLGHANLETTRIYTSLLAELSPNEANAYQNFLSGLLSL
jgi:integrase